MIPKDEKTWLGVAGAGAAALLALYWAYPEKVFVFDGIMFAGIIERGVSEWREEVFNKRHLLFNPAMMAVRDLLARFGRVVPAYELMQRVNAVLGALGALAFLGALRALAVERRTAAAAALVFGGSMALCGRATEGQAYMALAFGGLLTLWRCAVLLERPTVLNALLAAAAYALGVLFHLADAVLALPLAVAVFFAWRRGARAAAAAIPAAGLLIAVPFAAIFKLSSLSDFWTFLGRASDLQRTGAVSAGGFLERLVKYAGAGPLERLARLLQQVFSSFFANALPSLAGTLLGVTLLTALGWACRGVFKDPEKRPRAILLLSGFLAMAGLEFLWLGGEYFWVVPTACLIGLGALALPTGKAAYLGGGAAMLMAWNIYAGLSPRARLENNDGYRRAIFVRDHTPYSSWIVVSGFGFANQKVYLAYFAKRSREVLEYYLNRDAKEVALAKFGAWAREQERLGIPMFLLPDLVDDARALGDLNKVYGVGMQDIMNAFGPGRLATVARQDASFAVHLFIPKAHPEPLFAVLAYSVLTESDQAKLAEFVGLLKEVGSGMSPAQRDATAKLLAASGYGGRLLMEGFGRYMSPEALLAAQGRLARFAEYQKTPNFHLRLGNLYGLLGRVDLLRKHWAEAYRMTGDKDLGARLKTLRP